MSAFPNDAAAYITGIVLGLLFGVALTVAIGMCIYKQQRIGAEIQAAEDEVQELRESADKSKYQKAA